MSVTIKSRFAVSVIANVTRAGLTFFVGLLIARALGPDSYGRMSFLLASFLAVKNFTDLASSSAFFTFLSQRQRSRSFILYYWVWMLVQFVVVLILIYFFLPASWLSYIWHGEGRNLILLAYVASFFQNAVWPISSQMAEAQRETIKVQWLNTFVILFHLIVILVLVFLKRITIEIILFALIIEWAYASWKAASLYKTFDDGETDKNTPKQFLEEFAVYCAPFIPYVIVGFVYEFADRWMLQHWGGSREQAYYAVASQFMAISLLATSSILRIFWKEISEAHHRNDIARVRFLYHTVSKGLYFVGAVVTGAVLPWTKEIIRIILGESYSEGAITMMLMFFYPIHQCIGQIGGTMLYATSKNKLQVAIGISFMIVSLFFSYLLIAPPDAAIPGLGLASQGLAWKMVVMQVIQVNIIAWFIARVFKWKFEWKFQVYGLLLTVGISLLLKLAITSVISSHELLKMALSSVLYLFCIGVVLLKFPSVTGIQKNEIYSFFNAVNPVRRFTSQRRNKKFDE